MSSKYVTFGGNKYIIFHTRTQEKCINGLVTNTLSLCSVNGLPVNTMSVTWNNDTESIIENTRQLIIRYVTSKELEPNPITDFEQWDGDFDVFDLRIR